MGPCPRSPGCSSGQLHAAWVEISSNRLDHAQTELQPCWIMGWKGEGEPASALLGTLKLSMIVELDSQITNLIKGGECSIDLRFHVHFPPRNGV